MRLFDRQAKTKILTPMTAAIQLPNALMGPSEDHKIEVRNASVSEAGEIATMECLNSSQVEQSRPNKPDMTRSPTTPAQIEASEAVKWPQHAQSRRSLLKATTALAGIQLVRGLVGLQRDYELIRLCEEFDELERVRSINPING